MIKIKPGTKIKLADMWLSTDKNGNKFLSGNISHMCFMTIFLDYIFPEKTPVFAAYLCTADNGRRRRRKKTVSVKYACLSKKVDSDNNEWLAGEISKGCCLKVEKNSKHNRSSEYPDYTAYICECDNEEDETALFL